MSLKYGCAVALAIMVASPAMAAEDSKTRVQLQNIKAYTAWDRNLTGKGVIVAVIDTGIDVNHVDLNGGKVIATKRFSQPTLAVSETKNGHGTAMASIIAGNLNDQGTVGVAYDAKIVFGQIGTDTKPDISLGGKAALWAAEQGAVVANMSFAASFDSAYVKSLVPSSVEKGVYIQTDPKRNTGSASYYGYANILSSYKSATDKGIILVMAAGNQNMPYAAAPGMLVTATDADGNLMLSGRAIVVGGLTSTLTPGLGMNDAAHICNKVAADGQACLDPYRLKDFFVVAPGTATTAAALTGNGTQVLSGTSVAAAYVTGAIGILRQAWPQLRPEQTVQLLFRTARDLGAPGVDEIYGWGLVDLDKATQPFGNLVANVPVAGAKPLTSNTGVVGPLIGKTTSFLNGSQFEDSFGRNFSVQLGSAAISTRSRSFQHPYLGLDGSLIRSFSSGAITAMQSRDGMAFNIQNKAFDFEFGASTNQRQVLGTYMDGYLGVTGSSNTWIAAGTGIQTGDWVASVKAYLGHSAVSNSAISALRFTNLLSFSGAAQIAKRGLFATHDVLALRARPISRVIRGHVDVTRVGGYQFTPADDGINISASPTIETERFSIGKFQPAQFALSYQLPAKEGVSFGLESSVSVRSRFTSAVMQARLGLMF